MTKIELTNMVQLSYFTDEDKKATSGGVRFAIVNVPEDSLPPMSERDEKFGCQLDLYFKKAAEILVNELGPVNIYGSRFMGKMTVVY